MKIAHIENLINDNALIAISETVKEKLQEQKRINIFKLLDRYISENVLSIFLAALMDSNQNHGMQTTFLKELINELSRSRVDRKEDADSLQKLDFAASFSKTEWIIPGTLRRLDILVHCLDENGDLNAVVGIEHKIDASERQKQISDYQRGLSNTYSQIPCFLLFLTKDSRESITANRMDRCILITVGYINLVATINKMVVDPSLNDDVRTLLISFREYLEHLSKLHFMTNDLSKKIREIYLDDQKREVIKFIYENFPKPTDVLLSAIAKLKELRPEFDYQNYYHKELKILLKYNEGFDYGIWLMLHCPDNYVTINSLYTVRLMLWIDDSGNKLKVRRHRSEIYFENSLNNCSEWSCWVNLWAGKNIALQDMGDSDASRIAHLMSQCIKDIEPKMLALEQRINNIMKEMEDAGN